MTELISLEEVKEIETDLLHNFRYPTTGQTRKLIETARAAHELQAQVEILSQALLNSESNCNNCLNRLQERLDRVRAEERERCAKLAESGNCCCADEIRALKEA